MSAKSLYCLRDKRANLLVGQPCLFPTPADAFRASVYSCHQNKDIQTFPDDYAFEFLGEMDMVTGKLTPATSDDWQKNYDVRDLLKVEIKE